MESANWFNIKLEVPQMNINRLLESSKRTCLIGKNIYTYEGYVDNKNWQPPMPGFFSSFKKSYGTFGICIGHLVGDLTEGVYPEMYENGRKLEFEHVRHRWTPAWQQTYYRCLPDTSYYPNSGCISFCEKKCITNEDVFFSHIVIRSDKREETRVKIKLVCPHEGEYSFDVTAGAVTLGKTFNAKVYIATKNTISKDNEFTLTIPANGSVSFSYSLAISKHDMKTAEKSAENIFENSDVCGANENNFNKFIAEFAPKLTTENIDILKIYYYRWYLVYRSLHKPSEVINNHPVQRDCIYESPYGGWFCCPVGLPVPLHIEEAKWMINPQYVYADTLNWIDGSCNYRGYIQHTPMAIWHLYLNHPNKELLKQGYNEYCKYALNRFNPQNDDLEFFKVTVGSWITGAEYQPAFYQYTDVKWDWTYDSEGVSKGLAPKESRLYRLDDITYSIANLIGCSKIAKELGKYEDSKKFSALADKSVKLLIKYFWNNEKKCFVSIDACTKMHCDEAICYDSFMPYLWNIVGEKFYEGFSYIADDKELSCTFGITTVNKKCPMYWFDNCIAGPAKSSVKEPHPYGCSWNGPVWPYAVSGVLEALGASSVNNKSLIELWLENFEKYTELHFLDGDRSTPVITEHYRPSDGYSFSQTCDYFHSTWIDLFMKYYAGIMIDENTITFSPFTKEEFTLTNVVIGGKKYEFTQKNINGNLVKEFYVV